MKLKQNRSSKTSKLGTRKTSRIDTIRRLNGGYDPRKITHKKGSNPHKSDFHKVYWPYIPVIIFVIGGLLFSIFRPAVKLPTASTGNVLSYATNMSHDGLLSSSNNRRAAAGVGNLSLNSKLNQAAQNKANDMRDRNYWAHNTPDGKEPWTFISAVGYSYLKAGENLAYAFLTSEDAVEGWMNSSAHRANLLDSNFSEVGFGMANASNFIGTGEETIVVAMYAKPANATASNPTPAPTTPKATPTPTPTPTPISAPTPTQQVAIAEEIKQPTSAVDTVVPHKTFEKSRINQPFNTDTPTDQIPTESKTTRLDQIIGSRNAFLIIVITIGTSLLVAFWITKHLVAVKRTLIHGEEFVIHHPIWDILMVILIAIVIYLSSLGGVVL